MSFSLDTIKMHITYDFYDSTLKSLNATGSYSEYIQEVKNKIEEMFRSKDNKRFITRTFENMNNYDLTKMLRCTRIDMQCYEKLRIKVKPLFLKQLRTQTNNPSLQIVDCENTNFLEQNRTFFQKTSQREILLGDKQ